MSDTAKCYVTAQGVQSDRNDTLDSMDKECLKR